jgi:hypothetical protein
MRGAKAKTFRLFERSELSSFKNAHPRPRPLKVSVHTAVSFNGSIYSVWLMSRRRLLTCVFCCLCLAPLSVAKYESRSMARMTKGRTVKLSFCRLDILGVARGFAENGFSQQLTIYLTSRAYEPVSNYLRLLLVKGAIIACGPMQPPHILFVADHNGTLLLLCQKQIY